MLTEVWSSVSAAIYIGQNILMGHVHDWPVLLSTHILLMIKKPMKLYELLVIGWWAWLKQ